MRRTTRTLAATLVAIIVLGGCGSEQPEAGIGSQPRPDDPVSTDAPPGDGNVEPIPDMEPRIVHDGDTLRVTAFGSSTCRPVAVDALARDSSTILVSTKSYRDMACTDDYGPTVSTVPAPSGIDWTTKVSGLIDVHGDTVVRVIDRS